MIHCLINQIIGPTRSVYRPRTLGTNVRRYRKGSKNAPERLLWDKCVHKVRALNGEYNIWIGWKFLFRLLFIGLLMSNYSQSNHFLFWTGNQTWILGTLSFRSAIQNLRGQLRMSRTANRWSTSVGPRLPTLVAKVSLIRYPAMKSVSSIGSYASFEDY